MNNSTAHNPFGCFRKQPLKSLRRGQGLGLRPGPARSDSGYANFLAEPHSEGMPSPGANANSTCLTQPCPNTDLILKRLRELILAGPPGRAQGPGPKPRALGSGPGQGPGPRARPEPWDLGLAGAGRNDEHYKLIQALPAQT